MPSAPPARRSWPPDRPECRRLRRYFRRRFHGMALEVAGKAELAQLVPHHVFRHVDRNKLLAVVHRDGVAHHFRQPRRTPRPGAHDLLFVARFSLRPSSLSDRPQTDPFSATFPSCPPFISSRAASQCNGPSTCCSVSCNRASAGPTASRDGGHRRFSLHHRPRDDPLGS